MRSQHALILISAGFLALTGLAHPASAQQSYWVTVNTSSQNGQTGFVDLQFNAGTLTSQAAYVTITNLTTDATLNPNAIQTTGNVTGTLAGGLTIVNGPGNPSSFTSTSVFTSATTNEFTQAITFGNTLQFYVTLSGPAISNAIGNNANGYSSSMFALDFPNSNQSGFLLTNNPGGSAGTIAVNLNGTTTALGYPDPNNNPSLVTFGPPPTATSAGNASATYSSSNQLVTLVATVTSPVATVNAGTVTFTVLNNGVALGNPVTSGMVNGGIAGANYKLPGGTAANAYTIQAVYNNKGTNFGSSSDSSHSLTVTQAAQTIAFPNPGTRNYGAAPFTIRATASSGLAVAFTSQTTNVCTVSGNTVTLADIGTCTIAANQAGNTNYQPAPTVTQSFTVSLSLSLVSLSPATTIGGESTTSNRVYLNGPAPPEGANVALQSSDPGTTLPASVNVASGSTHSAVFTIVTSNVTTSETVGISATYNGSSKSANLTVNPAAPSALLLSPNSVVGGTVTKINRVYLNSPAPSGGAVVSLTSSDPGTTVPQSVNVSGGLTASPAFSITTSPVSSQNVVNITASYNGFTQTSSLTVNPPSLSLLVLSPTSVVGGLSSTYNRVYLNGPAPTGGVTVTLQSGDPNATVPNSVNIAQGATASPVFTITTSSVAAQDTVTITAGFNGVNKTANLTINPASLSLLLLSPSSVVGGKSATGNRVYFTGPAYANTVVSLQSGDPTVTVPASVTVSAGKSASPAFTITTSTVSAQKTVTISATYNGVTKNATLTVNP